MQHTAKPTSGVPIAVDPQRDRPPVGSTLGPTQHDASALGVSGDWHDLSWHGRGCGDPSLLRSETGRLM